MAYQLAFQSKRFTQALSTIRKEHFYTEEIATVDRAEDIQTLLSQLTGMTEPQLKAYTSVIRNSELEIILHALKNPVPEKIKAKLFYILKTRIKKRFFLYNWILLQDYYENTSLLEAYALMKQYMQENHPLEYAQSVLSKIDLADGDLIHKAIQVLKQDGGRLNDFYKQYKIIRHSRFGEDLTRKFFEVCTQEELLLNFSIFREYINRKDAYSILMIAHYLKVCTVLEYIDEINESLVSLYGEPNSGDLFWEEIEPALKTKFNEWIQTRELRIYFGKNYPKFSFWRDYYHQIEITRHEDDGILIIKLPGEYVVVDLLDEPAHSYLYRKKFFAQQYERYQRNKEQGTNGWPIQKQDVLFIRDVQLSGVLANICTIVYEGVGRLYTMEIIEDNI